MVKVNIVFDKEVEIIGNIDNISLSVDKKTVVKTVTQNQTGNILVRDDSFNYQEIEYIVDWIRKPPIIKGAEDGGIYDKDVDLEYISPYGIEEIYINEYSDTFDIFTGEENFYENERIRLVPAKRSSLTARVISNTKDMEKYRYYLDGNLYATTSEKQYTYTGLNLWTFYTMKVEALDRYGNVLESKQTTRRTVPIENVSFSLEGNAETITVTGLPSTTFAVGAYAWKKGQQDSRKRLRFDSDHKTYCKAYIEDGIFGDYTGKCTISILVDYEDERGVAKTMDLIGTMLIPNQYNGNIGSGYPYKITENGNYFIRCTDEMGNESNVDFTIQK